MTDEERRALAAVTRLRREIAEDRRILDQDREELAPLAEAESTEDVDRSRLVHVAALIHSYYTALEALLERILRELDGDLPTGDRWHESLLFQAAAEVEGLRPAILTPELREELDLLRRFSHFFRHAYGLDLDRTRVLAEASRLLAVHDRPSTRLDGFDRFLARSAEELRGAD